MEIWKCYSFPKKKFPKYEKLEHKKKQLKLDIDFLNNCKQLGVYPKFLIFKLPNVSNKPTLTIRKRLLRSAINKRNKKTLKFFKRTQSIQKLLIYTAFFY